MRVARLVRAANDNGEWNSWYCQECGTNHFLLVGDASGTKICCASCWVDVTHFIAPVLETGAQCQP